MTADKNGCAIDGKSTSATSQNAESDELRRRLVKNDARDAVNLLIEAEKTSDDNQEITQVVKEAVDKLPDLYRLPVWLKYYEGLSSMDISRVLRVREETIRMQIARGIEQLRESVATAGYAMSITAVAGALASPCGETAPPALTAALSNIAMHMSPGATSAGSVATSSFSSATPAVGTTVSHVVGVIKMAIGVICLCAVVGTATLVYKKGSGKGNAGTKPFAAVMAAKSDKTLLGSPDFYPSPERPIGWRGDGTGRYPGATPPTEWWRRPGGPLNGMRVCAARPKDDPEEEGSFLLHGYLDKLLLKIGPFLPKDAEKALDEELIPNEAALDPDENEKIGGLTWVRSDSGAKSTADSEVYYFVTRVHAPSEGDMKCIITHSQKGLKIWFNGKEVYNYKGRNCDDPRNFGNPALHVIKGWNKFVFKLHCGAPSGYFQAQLCPVSNSYVTKNVVWMTKLPAAPNTFVNASMPIVVGDRIYMTSEKPDLICIDKANGKILWLKPNTYYDTLSDDERKTLSADPEKAKALDGLAGRAKQRSELADKLVQQINASVSKVGVTLEQRQAIDSLIREKEVADSELIYSFGAIDKKKYADWLWSKWLTSRYGHAVATPCSDGRHVYADFNMTGIGVCYDLEGNRKWATMTSPDLMCEHGNWQSPCLIEDKFVTQRRSAFWARDKNTGQIVWESPCNDDKPGLGSTTGFHVGKTAVVMSGDGRVVRVADGKELVSYRFGDNWTTPVVCDGTIFMCQTMFNRVYTIRSCRVPADAGGFQETKAVSFPFDALGTVASGLHLGDLCYALHNNGTLHVLDLAQGKELYAKFPDWRPSIFRDPAPGAVASPALAGKYIYLIDNHNVTIVIKPGPEFEQIGRNVLENIGPPVGPSAMEQTIATPVFDGNRIYIRGTEYLYCIGEK